MRKGFLGSLAVLAAGAGLTFGQSFNPPGPGGPPPGPLPGTLPPAGQTTGNPPPGVAPYAYSGPSGANAGFGYATPDGHPVIMPPGLEGMVPPGSMGAGAPGGAYGDPGYGYTDSNGRGRGILGSLINGVGHNRVWFGGEYLLWAPSSLRVNYPFATTSAPADLGILGRPTTASLFGANDDIGFDTASGYRVWAGVSWDDSGTFGGEASYFWLSKEARQSEFPGNAVGVPVLAVPFFDVSSGAQGSYVVSFPGINSGNILVSTDVQVQGAELNAVFNMNPAPDQPGGVVLLAGVRAMQIKENFGYVTRSETFGVPPGGVVPPGTLPPPAIGASFFPGAGGVFAGTFYGPALAPYSVLTTDLVQTRNDFIGGQIGFRGDIGYGNWFINVTGKAAAGYMRQRVDVIGYSTLTTGTGTANTVPGGFYNIPQDLGRHRADKFAVVPEGGISLGYQLFSWLRVSAGYTFIWASNVVRPTSSLTPMLNPHLIPVSPLYTGAAPNAFIPRAVTNDTDFHLHGFNAGIQISF